MIEEFGRQMIQNGFLPHGYCLTWTPSLVGTYLVSDGLIALSYFSMPLAIGYFAWRRQDFPYRWVLWMFVAFILSCGTTHLMGTFLLWQPLYWIDAALRAITAVVSAATAIALWPLIPRALRIPGHDQLQALNDELSREVEERRRVERELRLAHEELQTLHRAKEASLADALYRLDAHMNNSPLAAVELDASGRIIRWSETAERMFGWSAGEAMGQTIPDLGLVHGDDMAAAFKAIGEIKSGERPRNTHQNRNCRKDGAVLHCEWYNSAFRDEQGNLISTLHLALDVTERVKAEERSAEQERQFRQITETLPQLIWTCRGDGSADYFSPQWEAYTGRRAEECVGDGWADSIHPDDREGLLEAWVAAVARKETYNIEFRIRRHDGQYRWFSTRAIPLLDSSGQVVKWFGSNTDVHELKEAQGRLQASERRLGLALAAGGSAVWEADVATGVVSGDDSLYALDGYAPEEMRTLDDWFSIVHPDDAAGLPELVEELIEGRREQYSFEARLRTRDGRWRWNLAQAVVDSRDAQGRALCLVGTHTDIDARKRIEEALREERSLLQAILRNSPLPIFMKDLEGRFIVFNPVISSLIDVPAPEKIIGSGIFDLFPEEVARPLWEHDQRVIATNAPLQVEERVPHRDGTWHVYLAHKFPVRDIATGAVMGVGGISTDITAAKAAEAEIRRLNAELEDRVRERTAELEHANEALLHSNAELRHFAHATAHDLKTPLRSIVGFAQILQREAQGVENERLDEMAGLVVVNAKRLQALIESLLRYTRLDAQGLPREPVPLGAVAGEVVGSLRPMIEETGAEIRIGPLPIVSADRVQVAQVFQNLVENGIKYNQSKPPRVTIACERQEDGWVFSVADNGIGIDPRYHERIFEIFRRLHAYHEIPGAGIGLALCRRIVERHGGRMWVESRPGEGSTFYFTLPESEGTAT